MVSSSSSATHKYEGSVSLSPDSSWKMISVDSEKWKLSSQGKRHRWACPGVHVRGSCSARVPRSSLAEEGMCHHIVEDEVDGQEERQDDKREDGEQREESGLVEESQNKHMRMTHGVRTPHTRLEPRMCV